MTPIGMVLKTLTEIGSPYRVVREQRLIDEETHETFRVLYCVLCEEAAPVGKQDIQHKPGCPTAHLFELVIVAQARGLM